MKNIFRRILVFLGLLLVFAVLAIGPELLGDDAKSAVKGVVGEAYFLPVVIVVVLLALLVSVFWSDGDKIFNRSKKGEAEKKVKDKLFQKAREGQRKAFKERSDKKLAGRDFIDLEVSYTVEGSNDLATILNKGVTEGETEQDILKVFEGAEGRLLIIGLPGSGKTTLLLQLAIALLDKYEEQIPVVLDIATWQPRFKTIEEWAVELLPDMGFNKSLAQQLVAEKKLLPLFDGLDELGEGSRPDFLAAVEKYGTDSTNKFVITSRKAEYAATIDAAVEYQVVVNPFTLVQIREALQKKYSPERTAILGLIDTDEYFREAIKTPFYLNAVQLLFAHKNISQKLDFQASDLMGRHREITTAFVEHALGSFDRYAKDDARRWLAFLADRMDRRLMVGFELATMQYSWLKIEKSGRFWKGLLEGLVFSPVIVKYTALQGAIVGMVLGSFFFNMLFGIYWGLILGLFVGFLLSLYSGVNGALLGTIESDHRNYLKMNNPYQRFYGSMQYLHFSLVQHWHLCHLLRKKNLIVRRYTYFLEAAVEQNILEPGGGNWRFRHRILQDYFVTVWKKNYSDDETLADGLFTSRYI